MACAVKFTQFSSSSLPSIFSSSQIHLPKLRSPPSRPHVPFFKLPSHTIPVKWSLYRRLLQSAPDDLHRQAIRRRWRRPRKQYATSPSLTLQLLRKEELLLSDYKELRQSRQTLRVEKAIKSGNGASTPDSANTPISKPRMSASTLEEARASAGPHLEVYHEHPDLSIEAANRLQELQKKLLAFEQDSAISKQVTDNYRTSLERVSYALRPIRTPGLLFPSLLNAPLPRIKPQPLHMTMVMTHRQQARDRRILQLKSWQEMRLHLRNERQFDRSLGVFQEDQALDYIDATTADLKTSETADFKRLHTKFPLDILQQRDIARRSRPAVLTTQRRKKDTAARLGRIARASAKDQNSE